eukprot:CAMPEP_0201592898 /NCGR_PEP_ID=MMETSP0190_2-20130828/190658_1 /ASSEMBLY_ACC=CAM_ASM_000263 /TAXON_ID=37353 /ORGANISM="Rosalina sp." /LENGTH=173 /DNA_ID=CAMNT_0048051861 /DNA_START=1203 /DNA_END=1724 /DNA_ORIENTATION=-
MTKCQATLQKLEQKWKQKVKDAEKLADWCNLFGSLLCVAAIVTAIIAVNASNPFILVGAAVGAAVGVGVLIYGQQNLSAEKALLAKIKWMRKKMKSHEDRVQEFVENIENLGVPLNGMKMSNEDYEFINKWEKIAEHEQDLLKRAVDTFKKFRDNTGKSLEAIRKVQESVKLY